jgi:hypothetical protein
MTVSKLHNSQHQDSGQLFSAKQMHLKEEIILMKPVASECWFLCLECAKTHLQASRGQKNFPGTSPPGPQGGAPGRGRGRVEGEGEGKVGRGCKGRERERGEKGGKGGRGKGRIHVARPFTNDLWRHWPKPWLNPTSAVSTWWWIIHVNSLLKIYLTYLPMQQV